MFYRILADAVVMIHFAFVVFVVFGGFFVLWSRRVMWIHLPSVLWAILIEFTGWICPLTPLEHLLRQKSGALAYKSGFIEHYLLPVLYPSGLTRELQMILGVLVLMLNLGMYWWVLRQTRNAKDHK